MENNKKYESKEAIISAALDEFCEKSYEEASLNSVIKNSKTSKGTFYYHFENKEKLYFSLLKEGFDRKWRFIENHMASNQNDGLDADIFDKFLIQAKIGILFGKKYPKYHMLSNMFLKEKGTEVYKKALKYLQSNNEEMLANMIAEAYKNGEINNNISQSTAILIISHLFTAFDDIFDRGEDTESLLAKLNEYLSFIKHGLSAK